MAERKKATTRKPSAAGAAGTVRATGTTRARAATAAARGRRAPAGKAAAVAAVEAKPAAERRWERSRRRTLVGTVVSDKTPKTVIVEVTRLRQHPLYQKVIRVRKRFPTHDEKDEGRLGDVVRIEESRPRSATKRFQVVEVLSRAGEAREAAPGVATVEFELQEAAGVRGVLERTRGESVRPKETEQEREGGG